MSPFLKWLLFRVVIPGMITPIMEYTVKPLLAKLKKKSDDPGKPS